MAVALNGVIHQIPVKTGPGAMEEFTRKIRELFNIGPEAEIDVSFVCKVPCGSGEHPPILEVEDLNVEH